jgi:hypothetical protein
MIRFDLKIHWFNAVDRRHFEIIIFDYAFGETPGQNMPINLQAVSSSCLGDARRSNAVNASDPKVNIDRYARCQN